MPTVSVYVHAKDYRMLKSAGKDPEKWIRNSVKASLANFPSPESSGIHSKHPPAEREKLNAPCPEQIPPNVRCSKCGNVHS